MCCANCLDVPILRLGEKKVKYRQTHTMPLPSNFFIKFNLISVLSLVTTTFALGS